RRLSGVHEKNRRAFARPPRLGAHERPRTHLPSRRAEPGTVFRKRKTGSTDAAGAARRAERPGPQAGDREARMIDFHSHVIPETIIGAMRADPERYATRIEDAGGRR